MGKCADVCLSMDYDGSNEFYREETRKAGKAHKCCECGDVIPVGALHQVAAGKTEGVFFTERTCDPCAEIRAAFCCDGWIFRMLWETVSEELFPHWNKDLTAIDCLAKLTTDVAVAKMKQRYADYQEEQPNG